MSWQTIDGEDISNGALKNFDALVIPGGSAKKEAMSMGSEAREEVRRFVKEGGIYMGVCAGAYLASSARDSYLRLLPLRTLDQEHWYRTVNGTPLNVELTPIGQEVFGLSKSNLRIVYENGPIFAPPDQKPDDSFATLGSFRSEVVARGGERGVMIGAPIAVISRYGRGMVLAISPHPEKTPGLRKVELHALHWLYEHRAQ
jgi:putative intracellular protease/amidase